MTRTAQLAIFFALSGPAAAHQIWIEPDASGTPQIHFGEYGENLREVSGKLLDRIQPVARLVSGAGETAVEIRRGENGLAVSNRPGPGESLIAEDTRYPISERKTGNETIRSIYRPAARFVSDLAERKVALTLDVTPTATPGRFVVTFRGAPLPTATVKVVAASGWEREERTDKAGEFGAAFPWKGSYAIEVKHTDSVPGARDGHRYDRINFVTTLSFSQAAGLEPPPPPPPAQPND